jgi:hypothetical protein
MSVAVIGGGDYTAPQVADRIVWKTQILSHVETEITGGVP